LQGFPEGEAKKMFNERVKNDVEYNDAITTGTNAVWRIKKANDVANEILKGLLND
jgi:hypothetical protein